MCAKLHIILELRACHIKNADYICECVKNVLSLQLNMNEVQRINLEEYIQTGEGGQALSYTRIIS